MSQQVIHSSTTQTADLVTWITQHYPQQVAAMRQCNHHYSDRQLNPWHLEGDVWTHTMLVLKAYALSNDVDDVVGWTALLHDIGKVGAARVLHDKQRVVFKGHEALSAWIAWDWLQHPSLTLPLADRLRIFSLIALHGCVYTGWFNDKTAIEQQLALAFSGVDALFWQQLQRQYRYDAAGQITLNDNNKLLLDLVERQAPPQTVADQIPAVLFIGVAGAGKTSLRQRYAGYCIISRDDMLLQITEETDYLRAWQQQETQQLSPRIEAALTARFQQAVAAQQPIVVDMTNLTRKARQRWLSSLDDNYRAEAVLVVQGEQQLLQRNQTRQDKTLTGRVLNQMMLSFEHPLFDEFARIDYVVDGHFMPFGQRQHKEVAIS